MSDVSKNTCVNCKYFIQHYVKLKYKFRKIECGHCINNFMKKSELIETAENLRKIERFLHSD